MSAAPINRISGGAPRGMPTCPTCPHLTADTTFPGWGWCSHPRNREYGGGWVNGFTPSQSPSGSCELHPERARECTCSAADMPFGRCCKARAAS